MASYRMIYGHMESLDHNKKVGVTLVGNRRALTKFSVDRRDGYLALGLANICWKLERGTAERVTVALSLFCTPQMSRQASKGFFVIHSVL